METTGKPKVLVIDDDKVVADTLAMVLNANGYVAIAAYSGERALDLAGQTGFDHLVTDVMMGPMNGIQAAIAIQAICPNCTVLLMSGNQRTTDILAEAARNGYKFEILAKPVHPTLILDRLHDRATGGDTPQMKGPLLS